MFFFGMNFMFHRNKAFHPSYEWISYAKLLEIENQWQMMWHFNLFSFKCSVDHSWLEHLYLLNFVSAHMNYEFPTLTHANKHPKRWVNLVMCFNKHWANYWALKELFISTVCKFILNGTQEFLFSDIIFL